MLGSDRVDLPPAGQEMLVDQIFADHGTIDCGQVHANYADLLFSFQGKVRFSRAAFQNALFRIHLSRLL
jgi:hypothetical protein